MIPLIVFTSALDLQCAAAKSIGLFVERGKRGRKSDGKGEEKVMGPSRLWEVLEGSQPQCMQRGLILLCSGLATENIGNDTKYFLNPPTPCPSHRWSTKAHVNRRAAMQRVYGGSTCAHPLRYVEEFHRGQSWQRLATTQPHRCASDCQIENMLICSWGLLFVCLITSFFILNLFLTRKPNMSMNWQRRIETFRENQTLVKMCVCVLGGGWFLALVSGNVANLEFKVKKKNAQRGVDDCLVKSCAPLDLKPAAAGAKETWTRCGNGSACKESSLCVARFMNLFLTLSFLYWYI